MTGQACEDLIERDLISFSNPSIGVEVEALYEAA
jgi:hypothetical protein